MKLRLLLVYPALLISGLLQAQTPDVFVEDTYNRLTDKWLMISREMQNYSGLTKFCDDAEFREMALGTLKSIHHYDSLILDLLKDPTLKLSVSHQEYKETVKDFEKLETEYGAKAFLQVIKESCVTMRELEKDKEKLKRQSGVYSYDGQIMNLENYLMGYLNHLDKKVVKMKDHIHNIHPDQLKSIEGLVKEN